MNTLDAITNSAVVLGAFLGQHFPGVRCLKFCVATVQEDCLFCLVHCEGVRSVDDVLSVPSSADGSPAEGNAGDSLEPPEGVPVEGPQTLGRWLAGGQGAFFAWCDGLVSPSPAVPESRDDAVPEKKFKWGACKKCGKAMSPTVHATGALRGEFLLRCNDWWRFTDDKKRKCWYLQKYQGEISDLPYFVRQKRKSMKEDLTWHFSHQSR